MSRRVSQFVLFSVAQLSKHDEVKSFVSGFPRRGFLPPTAHGRVPCFYSPRLAGAGGGGCWKPELGVGRRSERRLFESRGGVGQKALRYARVREGCRGDLCGAALNNV